MRYWLTRSNVMGLSSKSKQSCLAIDIDMIAGPSEIGVIADDSANPVHLAADLLSQAEHDPRARAIMVTTSESLAKCRIR